jgi:hypothetical protein
LRIAITVEVRANLLFAVEQFRQLAHRQAVPDRHRRQVARKAHGGFVQHGPLNRDAADRIGAVEHEHLDLSRRGLLHHVGQRRHVRVEARADVLQVDHHRVETGQRFCSGPALCAGAVQGVNRQAGLFVVRGRHVASRMPRMPCSGLNSAASLTFGAERADRSSRRRPSRGPCDS